MYCQNSAQQHQTRATDCVGSSVKYASPGVMQDIVDTKAYVTIGINVLEYVLSHDQLQAAEKILWVHVYAKASKYQNWTAQITVEILAKELGLHRRSIQRQVGALVEHGLMVREERFYEGRQIENAFRVSIPYDLGQLILKTVPNRRRPSLSPITNKLQHRISKKVTVKCGRRGGGRTVDKSPGDARTVAPGSGSHATPNINNSQQVLPQQHTPSSGGGNDRHVVTRGLTDMSSLLSERKILTPVEQTGLSTKTERWTRTKLEGLGFVGLAGEKLLLELRFSCEHGAKWGSAPMMKRINICLKLIRTGRWRTPRGFGH